VTKLPEGEEPKEKEEIKAVDVENLKTATGVPDFWYRAIKNNQMIYELVKEKDDEILKNLRHVESERSDAPKALTVRFLFNKNEFFTNDTLTLKVFYKGDQDDVEKVEGTEIQWNESKDPTKKKVKKKQKNKKTNETRTIVKTVEADSFFNVFTNRTAPDENTNMESEEENEL
jgi:nucleosome assembly protein 1-like 1